MHAGARIWGVVAVGLVAIGVVVARGCSDTEPVSGAPEGPHVSEGGDDRQSARPEERRARRVRDRRPAEPGERDPVGGEAPPEGVTDPVDVGERIAVERVRQARAVLHELTEVLRLTEPLVESGHASEHSLLALRVEIALTRAFASTGTERNEALFEIERLAPGLADGHAALREAGMVSVEEAERMRAAVGGVRLAGDFLRSTLAGPADERVTALDEALPPTDAKGTGWISAIGEREAMVLTVWSARMGWTAAREAVLREIADGKGAAFPAPRRAAAAMELEFLRAQAGICKPDIALRSAEELRNAVAEECTAEERAALDALIGLLRWEAGPGPDLWKQVF